MIAAGAARQVMMQCWIGGASSDHVLISVRGGFCRLNLKKDASMKRPTPGRSLTIDRFGTASNPRL